MSTKQQPLPGDIIMEDDLMQNIDKYMNWLQSIDVITSWWRSTNITN